MGGGPQAGTREATEFERLLVPVLEAAYRTAFRLTGNEAEAQDLVQDAALLALRGFGSFRRGSNFRAWFFRILMNRFYSTYRRQRRAGVAVDLDDAEDLYLFQQAMASGALAESDPAEAVLGRIDADAAVAALRLLPDEFRTVATLYFTQDFSYEEIADVLQIPIGTVRSRLHRARRILQKALWRVARERGIVSPSGDGEGSA
jgi:RNA polymerase sigma-70 factor (ECF subfamily)